MQVWAPGPTLSSITITESPYYIALQKNDPAVFEAYQEVMRDLPSAPSEISWSQFLDLRDDIAVNGLRDVGSPITLYSKGQLDGHHRLAILCHLYGPAAEVMVWDNIVTFPAPPVAQQLWNRLTAGLSPRRNLAHTLAPTRQQSSPSRWISSASRQRTERMDERSRR